MLSGAYTRMLLLFGPSPQRPHEVYEVILTKSGGLRFFVSFVHRQGILRWSSTFRTSRSRLLFSCQRCMERHQVSMLHEVHELCRG